MRRTAPEKPFPWPSQHSRRAESSLNSHARALVTAGEVSVRLELVSLALHQPFFLQKPLFSCSSHWHSQPLQPPSQGHAAEEAAQSRPPRSDTPPVPSTEMPPGVIPPPELEAHTFLLQTPPCCPRHPLGSPGHSWRQRAWFCSLCPQTHAGPCSPWGRGRSPSGGSELPAGVCGGAAGHRSRCPEGPGLP